MRPWVRNISFLLIVGASLENLGLLGHDLYRLLALLSFLVFVSTFLPGLPSVRGARFSRILGAILFAAAGVLLAGSAELGLLHLYLFLSIGFVLVFWRQDSDDIRQLTTYVVALACIAVLAELVRILPVLWHIRAGLASALSYVGETLAREDRNLGPTAMALPLWVSLMVLAVVREASAEHRHRIRWLTVIVVLFLAHLLYLIMLKYYARWLGTRPGWDSLLLNSQHLFLVFGTIVYTLLDRGKPMRFLKPRRFRRVAYTSVAAFAVGVVAAMTLGWAAAPQHRQTRVMIYDAGYVNWDIPVHGKYGERSAGMFGMLPSTLEAVGFDVVVSDDLALLGRHDRPDCVVMINIQKYLEDEEKDRVWRFISEGGGLLCLGDHTGVAGIRGPFNDLLEPVGIRFRFDSSTFFGRGWNDALDCRPHPLTRDVDNAEDFQIWVGATLDLDLSARPVIVGRYGYSDIGNAANIDRSYLGDRRYNPDELLGDIVLVADAAYGRGKVMVFGDTSGYQNLSLASTLDTVARSLDYLGRSSRFGAGLVLQAAALVLFLLVILGAVALAKNPLPVVAVAFGLAVGSAAVHLVTPEPRRLIPTFLDKSPTFSFSPTPHIKRDLAILDVSHGGHHTLRAWNDNSIGGLQLNLARNGYFPLIRNEFPYRELSGGAQLLLLVAPTRRYNRREIEAIEEFLVGGGNVIATVGFEELEGSRDLLDHFGISIVNAPLGRFQVAEEPDTLSVVFHEGWPVQFDDKAATEVLLAKWGLPLAIGRTVGRGKLVVIGDSSFFHDVNLETLDKYFSGNVAFLRRLTGVEQVQ